MRADTEAGRALTRLTRRARVGIFDSASFLTLYIVVLYAIPSNQSIHALGSAGSVSIVLGGVALLLWSLDRLQRLLVSRPRQITPVGVAQFVFLIAALASYVAAMTRALPAEEVNTADTGLIRLLAWAGILLIASDGIPTMLRFYKVLSRLAVAGGLLAALGLLQFVTNLSFVDLVSIPGLTVDSGYAEVDTRGGVVRSAGTAEHPLEYGMVLAMIFPIALSLAIYDRKRPFLLRWVSPVLILLALLLSGSRSAILGLAAGVLVLVPSLSASLRWRFAVAAIGAVAVAYAVSPKAVTTLRYLFVSIGDDPSAASRADSQGIVVQFFLRNPVFGRGFGTFLPAYRILDNQYLLALIEVGLAGLILLAGMLITAIVCTVITARSTHDPVVRKMGYALAGSIVSAGVLLALFDALSFPQAAGSLFLFMGLCGAYRRLAANSVPSLTGIKPQG